MAEPARRLGRAGAAPRHLPTSRHLRRAGLVIAATAAAIATCLVLASIPGVTVRVRTYAGSPPFTRALGLGQVIITALEGGLLAGGVLAGLDRFTSHPRRQWTVFAPVGAVASLLLPLSAPAERPAAPLPRRLSIVVGSVLVVGLRLTASVR